MKEKWIETIIGDFVRWSDIVKIYHVYKGDSKLGSYSSHFMTKDGNEKDFVDTTDLLFDIDGQKARMIDAFELMLLHELLIKEIEDHDAIVIKIFDTVDLIWDEFMTVREATNAGKGI